MIHAAYSTLTAISQPDCMRYPFVSRAAADACSAEANETRKDFAPGFGAGCEDGGGAEDGEAVEKPGYLQVRHSQNCNDVLREESAHDTLVALWRQVCANEHGASGSTGWQCCCQYLYDTHRSRTLTILVVLHFNLHFFFFFIFVRLDLFRRRCPFSIFQRSLTQSRFFLLPFFLQCLVLALCTRYDQFRSFDRFCFS